MTEFMVQYIDKSALVAEIERRIKFFTEESGNSNSDIVIALFGLKSFLETLEVKEVDLDKELDKYTADNFWALEGNNESPYLVEKDDMLKVAKHFFELGARVNNQPITAADRGIIKEIIFALNALGEEKKISYGKEIEWLRNKVKKGE